MTQVIAPVKNLLVIDSLVSNWQSLATGVGTDNAVLILDSGSDGLTQISDYLTTLAASTQDFVPLQSLQIISHGSAGSLLLGSSTLTTGSLKQYTSQLANIGSSLTDTGDILLYGCNVAAGQAGLDFINQFAALTNADVAASNDVTGSAALGGNWLLEANTGPIEAALSLNTAISNTYTSILPSDTTAPTLTSLTFPTTINLSSGNQSVSFAAHAEDAGSGVNTVNVWFDKSLTTNIGSYNLWMISSGWTDSTPSDASVGHTVQSYNNPGIYNITSVDVKDLAGNSRSYTTAELSSLGIATSFNITDGVSIPNALTATPSMEQGKIILSLSAAQWSASSNSLAFTLAYDSSVVHFDSWRAGSSGSYSVSSSILEVGASATVSMTGSINNSGDKTDFLQLVFTTTAQQGSFAYNFSSETLNSQTLANVSGNYSFSVVDAVAPIVSIFNPADEATDIAISSNIVLTFSEAIQKGTGTIAIHSDSATGTILESFNAAISNRLIFSGSSLTIDPSADLVNNTAYFVTFDAGSVKDLAGNNYAGTTIYDFTTAPTIAPTLSAFSSTVASGTEDSQIAISFANLQAQGNEADIDGTVAAFVIKAVSTGTLLIGTSAGAATAWDASTNSTVDESRLAYWTPTAHANGTLNAFTAVAKDNGGLESANAIQATVAVIDNIPPSVTMTDNLSGTANRTTASIAYNLAFSEAVTGLDATDFTVTNGTVSSVIGTISLGNSRGSSWTVNVTPALGVSNGSIGLTLKAGAVSDGAGNLNASVTNSSQAIDTVAPVAPKLITNAAFNALIDPQLTLQTSLGAVVLDLNPALAPITVANMLAYANTGFYDNTLFHRVMAGFMVQGGGLTSGLVNVTPTYNPIVLESNNGLSNLRGTIAMARTNVADSATAQFFVNLVDNAFLNYSSSASPGYAVFGKVVSGMSVIDSIAQVPTKTVGTYANVPVTDITITSAQQTLAGSSITNAATLTVSDLEVGAQWNYSLDSGSTWIAGTGNSFVVPVGNYAASAIQVRQTDAAGNVSASAGKLTSALVVETTAPTVTGFSPADGNTDAALANNIVLTFSETIQKGTGLIQLHRGSATGTVIESFDAASSNRLAISGNTLTIDPTSTLANSSHYFVTFDSGSVKDLAGNNYAGISSYDFTTIAATSSASTISDILSVGMSPDNSELLIKFNSGELIVVPNSQGGAVTLGNTTYSTADITQHTAPQAVFSSLGNNQKSYVLPDLYTGPASLNLKYQLIDASVNAVIVGSTDNDFIKLGGSGNKAVSGGGGNNVIDGGTGSTFISGGGTTSNSNTFFLDGRASGTSWSTITDFHLNHDYATIWGWLAGVSKVDTLFTDVNTGGAAGYTGLTLHFDNLLPDGSSSSANNANLNSITLSGHTLAEFGASSLVDLNNQIANGINTHFITGQTHDSLGDHGYLWIH